MAKVAYSKLNCKLNTEIKTVEVADVAIEVRQYLPIQEKLALIGRVIELAHEQDANYSNPVKADVYMLMEMIFAYTNITFTDKQKEDIAKLYDQLCSSGVLAEIMEAIPENEREMIEYGVAASIESVYKYQNSVLGIMDTLQKDYANMELDIDKLKDNISDPELLGFLKEVLSKMN